MIYTLLGDPLKFWQLRMDCGSALTPQAPVMLALSQQQHQLAACLASMMHNLHTGIAQIHYTQPLFRLRQRLSACFITFSPQHDFTPVSSRTDAVLTLDKDYICEARTHNINSKVIVRFLIGQKKQHNETQVHAMEIRRD